MKIIVNGRDVSKQKRCRTSTICDIRMQLASFKKHFSQYKNFKVTKVVMASEVQDEFAPAVYTVTNLDRSVKVGKLPGFKDFAEDLEVSASLVFLYLKSVDFSYRA